MPIMRRRVHGEIQRAKKAATKQINNQVKRATRLKQNAARLSNADLIDVLTMRRAATSRDTPTVAAEDPCTSATSSPPASEEVGAELLFDRARGLLGEPGPVRARVPCDR